MKPITFTKKDIVEQTSKKLGISERNMKDIVESVIETMTGMLTQPESRLRIELRNFGVFEIKPTKAKPKARNPQTNEEIYVPPRRKIMFRPGKIIRDQIQQEWNDKD